MITVQQRLNKELEQGKSIAWWAMGYYLSLGGPHGFDLKIPIFGWEAETETTSCRVLVDYLGAMMWINIRPEQLHYGWGGQNPPSPEGKEIRARLESIKEYS